MNIEINNDDIEKMIEKKVAEKVNQWFKTDSNKYFIRGAVNKAVEKAVTDKMNETEFDIPKMVSSIGTKKLANEIIENIGYNFAAILAEKYGD